MEAAISVRELRKDFGDVEAVRGVDLEVQSGEVFALLGPNGAGKTTTVEILEGYQTASAGRVTVLGLDPRHDRRRMLERVGIVLQETAVEQFLTVREVLRRRTACYPHPRDPDGVIELIGLGEKADARVRTLSGGQQRRLDLGMALVGDPELLFLDEPTTGFDPNARREAWDIVRNLTGEGRTVLLTTHYMEEAQALADRVAVIRKGVIVATGRPDSIGGRDTGTARIRFVLPERVTDVAQLELGTVDPPTVSSADGRRVIEVNTDSPTALLYRLTSWAVARQIELESLEVARPSLEDVYLSLTAEDT
ncbi:MAG TPA: ABC transporter ATP-binding protein [Acidimicrobiales bacterium]|nr:ABC transporter ATP-binding protein [Acidimicrobiales bacterium]